MLKLFLWLKNLRRKKIVLLSIAAVSLSCALLIVVASIFSGFIRAVETSANDIVGDIVIKPPVRFAFAPILIADLKNIPAVKTATPILQTQGLLRLAGGDVRAVAVWGIDPAGRAEVMNFKPTLLKQKNLSAAPTFALEKDTASLGGFLGIGVIAEPNEKTDLYDINAAKEMIGKQVVLITGASVEDGANALKFKTHTVKFTVADIVFTGVYELDSTFIYLPLDMLQETLYSGQNGLVDMIQVKLEKGIPPEIAIGSIRLAFDNFARSSLKWGNYLVSETRIETAREFQSLYIGELKKQMALLMVIFGAASLGVILLVFCIFYMIVITKQKDIAILKSIGASNNSIAALFVGYGVFIGIVGSLAGVILGYVFLKNINEIEAWIAHLFGLKLWKSSVYIFDKIPNQLDITAVYWIAAAAVLAAAIGALLPAVAAAKLQPVKILRYE